ncbi:MFS transporter [Nocardia mexicana]|uniref:EmrB/QacA subfamily drug resistance transporter n=1 Tax=Nocardia mexicana TaxID=279262 RepID=A0A370H8S5_9NOCA|nr:MFS transporter [Nocardia mexicana]RDI53075.1 EmrB/QacA subfamily drug resistance transporter [Nocardia mexicana]
MTVPTARAARPNIALATVTAVLFVTFLDTTIVSVALGDIQSDLHAGVVPLQWVVNAYTLVFASLMLTLGSLGDRWGRKRVLVAGLVIFCAGSVLSATATSVAVLIAGRGVMGLGAAASEPGTLSVIRHIYPDRGDRAKALGAWAAVSGLALAAGPVVGGLLVGAFGWQSIFWFNLVVGVVVLGAALRYVPESADPQPGPVDRAGFVLGATFLGCVIYAGISGEEVGYDATSVVVLFVIGGLAFLGFLVVEMRARNPMFDFRYLKRPMVRSALIVAFAVYFGIFSIFFFTALYLQEVIGYSGWRTAAVFAPMAVAIVLGSLVAGFWVALRGSRTPMIIGCLLGATGILLARECLGVTVDFTPLALALTVAGLGFGIAVVPLTSAVLSGVPAEHSGMAAAATNTMRQVGAVVGVAALGSLVNSFLDADLVRRLNELDIPANFQAIVIDAIKTGSVPAGGDPSASAAYGPIVDQVIHATYAAFHRGLDVALLVSGIMILVAAGLTALSGYRAGDRSGYEYET